MRNLQEQVQKNKEDIARHYAIDRALANLGIEIIGQVSNPEDLPDPTTYEGQYGDTYAVGDKEAVNAGNGSYDYYVYTRPDPNAGYNTNYWLNVGKISIVGPQGPQGIQGPQGPAGTSPKWYTNTYPSNPQEGDMFLGSLGNVFQYTNNTWVLITNIQGPQGIQGLQGPQGLRGERGEQGPQGERGDVGGFINIAGIVESTDQLPAPSSLDNLTVAYLIGTAAPYTLYIQVGSTSDTAIWTNVGDLNVATYVTSGGAYQNVWDADTKLDRDINKYSEAELDKNSTCYIIYYHNYFKSWIKKAVAQTGDNEGKVIAGNNDGQIKQNLAPSADNDLTNKAYVDETVDNKNANIQEWDATKQYKKGDLVYVKKAYSYTPGNCYLGFVAKQDNIGQQPTTAKNDYWDHAIAPIAAHPYNAGADLKKIIGYASDSNGQWIPATRDVTGKSTTTTSTYSPVSTDGVGGINIVNAPTNPTHLTNKLYVDGQIENNTSFGIVEAGGDSTQWYRKYKDGHIEIGGVLTVGSELGAAVGSTVDTTITFPSGIAFADANYVIQMTNQWTSAQGHSIVWGVSGTKSTTSVTVTAARAWSVGTVKHTPKCTYFITGK